ncbi:alpha/beta hydrolase [Actinoplanes solisilvae]|uniref:alpha/beta hydrolase n=1 Tax=Actinoplanes solisilvae TaxID=2486853 RepID=UPI00196B8958|nr:alpha/beta hydrolase [Actinoplanes solisilvae]
MTIEEKAGVGRRSLLAAAAAGGVAALTPMSAAVAGGPGGSVSDAPGLPSGFGKVFSSRFVTANGLRQHAVVGGSGPPLLLVHGWPESWYAWRLIMPALARDYTVVAVDQRGIGLTGRPSGGYDSATLAKDSAALMSALGHRRFAVVGHDTGYAIAYALAADFRERVDRVVLMEIPGPPGAGPGPELFVPEAQNNRLWHIPFNRVDDELIIDMVHGNARAFYHYEFRIQGGPALPERVIDYYVRLYNRNRDTLRGTFGLYRAWDALLAQNKKRAARKLTAPVLGIGGQQSWGRLPGHGRFNIIP